MLQSSRDSIAQNRVQGQYHTMAEGKTPRGSNSLAREVRVLDIGLNGILITPQQTSRTVEIYCEAWVEPTSHPFVVLARREGKNTEHAAPSVLLCSLTAKCCATRRISTRPPRCCSAAQ